MQLYPVSDLLFFSPSGHLEQMCMKGLFPPSLDGASSHGFALNLAFTAASHKLFKLH